MGKQGEGGAQLVFLERLADQRGCPKLRGNGRAFVVARHEDKRNVARLEDCGNGETHSFMELHIQQGAVERVFSGQLTSLLQPADRTDRLQAAVVQEIADHFGQQVAVFDDEDLLSVPCPVVTQAWRCLMHRRKRYPGIVERSPPCNDGPKAFPEPFATEPCAVTNLWQRISALDGSRRDDLRPLAAQDSIGL